MRTTSLFSLAFLFLAASSADAQEDRGRLHFQAGASYYEAGDYEDALREFERAFELSERPELYYNFSLCFQQLGDLEKATDFLGRYLAEVADVPNRGNLERRLENFRERLANSQEAPAVEEGEQLVEDPHEAEEGAATEQTEEEQEVESQVVTPAPEPSSGGPNVGAIVSFAAAGVGAVMWGVFGGLALGEKGDLEDMGCGTTTACDAGSLRTLALMSDIGLGVMLVGATLGVVLLVTGGGDDDEEQASVEVSPWVGRNGAGAALGGRF